MCDRLCIHSQQKMAKCRDPHEVTGEINEDIAKIVNDREPRNPTTPSNKKTELKWPIHIELYLVYICVFTHIYYLETRQSE